MIDALGGWDERYFVADTELWLRMLFRTEVRKIDARLANRRLHEGQRNHQAARDRKRLPADDRGIGGYRGLVPSSARFGARGGKPDRIAVQSFWIAPRRQHVSLARPPLRSPPNYPMVAFTPDHPRLFVAQSAGCVH